MEGSISWWNKFKCIEDSQASPAAEPSIVAADGNLSEHSLKIIVQSCFERKIPGE